MKRLKKLIMKAIVIAVFHHIIMLTLQDPTVPAKNNIIKRKN